MSSRCRGDQNDPWSARATIIKLLNIDHPAAKSLADVAKSQDNEVGDGTTSVMILAGELLKEAKQFIEDGMSPQVIINGYWTALVAAREKLAEIAVKIDDKSEVSYKFALNMNR